MPQVFRPRANGVARFVLWGAFGAGVLVIALGTLLPRSGYVTDMGQAVEQPVPFSHQHHVGGLGIDCRYCHNAVERSSSAGLPATEVCMTCHSRLWAQAEMLAPVRRSVAAGEPLEWRRVNTVQDFVYFNHSIHVNSGVGCVTCHGPVDRMPLMRAARPLTMSFCLGCHRNPQPNLRPPEAVFSTGWTPPESATELRASLMHRMEIDPEALTDCYVCHR